VVKQESEGAMTDLEEIEITQLARLCDEARAVITHAQIAEMAVSMDMTCAEVEARFFHAQVIFEHAKKQVCHD
jgi:hypothetical protein